MFLDNALASDTSELGASANTTRHRTSAHSLDHSTVLGARRGFEGLIINRGRHRERSSRPTSAASRSALAAEHIAKLKALQGGIAESLDQIEAARIASCPIATRGVDIASGRREFSLWARSWAKQTATRIDAASIAPLSFGIKVIHGVRGTSRREDSDVESFYNLYSTAFRAPTKDSDVE